MKSAACLMVVSVFGMVACTPPEPRLVTGAQVIGDAIPYPLSAVSGQTDEGRAVFAGRDRGHCVLCHAVETLDAEFQGNVGPDLTFVGDRLRPGQLRLRIADYEVLKPGVLMPSYYRTHGFHQVAAAHTGEPVLTADEIEHLVAYLSSLKEQP